MFQTAKRTLAEFKEGNLTDAAAALTYYAALSIFPALAAMIALGLVANPQTITTELTELVSSIGPASSAQTFKEPIASLAHGISATGILLVAGVAGVAGALWTASGQARRPGGCNRAAPAVCGRLPADARQIGFAGQRDYAGGAG
jgi:membrane protein